MKMTQTKDGIVIEVFVKFNAPRFDVKFDGKELLVFSAKEPIKGKVNKDLMKEFSKLFHNRAVIVSGVTSRTKRILIENASKDEVANVINSLETV
jgi:uncharacterized protein (TIGR00251 family)